MQALRDQVASSPVQPSPEQPLLSPFPSSPSPAPGVFAGRIESRKRPCEDMTQFAATISRSFKLQKCDQDALKIFTKYDPREQQIWLAASMLKVQERQAVMTPLNVIYTIPKNIENKIEHYSFIILLNPTIPAYIHKDGPVNMLMDLLDENPSWGLTPGIKDDKLKYDVIVGRVRNRFTSRRYDIKKILADSLGVKNPEDPECTKRLGSLDIVTLCRKLSKLYRPANLNVTVQLCARIAFLRYLIAEKPTGKFWEEVDKELITTRTSLRTPRKQSKFFGNLLELDRDTYGNADLNELNAQPTTSAPGSFRIASPTTPTPRSIASPEGDATGTGHDDDTEED